jgi:hypothetical protein
LNRLAESRSPYLRQHAENPVDWWEWGEEAWAEARRLERPVFLSVGYSACHWCHVMAHESFEDPEVAAALNQGFVCVKVDREERPDVDEVYMTAVQVSTGHGGWPMSVFLTPAGEPFFAGTYFPKTGRGGHPGFLQIVTALSDAWRSDRAAVLESAAQFAAAVRAGLDRAIPASGATVGELAAQAVRESARTFDWEHGGLQGSPKFPPHSLLAFWQAYSAWPRAEADLAQAAAAMAEATLDAIVRGGIHDHVGGGFHRYSTDAQWHLPHFEKMAYDNGLLLGALARSGGHPRAVRRLVGWLRRELQHEDGWFFSALDADTDGEEGATYVWTLGEMQAALEESVIDAAACFQATVEGNYRDEATGALTGRNVLHVPPGWSPDEAWLDLLLAARVLRPQPGIDDKAVASWNAFVVSGLVAAAEVDEARRSAEAWCDQSPLPRILGGDVPAFLEDYAALADAFFDLAEAGAGDEWTCRGQSLTDQMVELFGPVEGLLPFRHSGHGQLLGASRPILDGATPSPNALALRALRRAGRAAEAHALASAALGWCGRAPTACAATLVELLALGEPRPGRSAGAAALEVRLEPAETERDSQGNATAEVVVSVPPGHTLVSHEPVAAWLDPLVVRVEGAAAQAGFPESPAGVFVGEVRIALRLHSRTPEDFTVRVRGQLCTDAECLLPQEAVAFGRLV